MTAGNLVGSILLTIFFGALWLVLGKMVDMIARIANITMLQMPVFQDGINGFNQASGIFGILGVIILGGIWANYILNELSASTMEV
jgi:hypothetical protein